MIVQIYAVTSIANALTMAELGVDHVGFVVSECAKRDVVLSIEEAHAVAEALRGRALSSALTFARDLDEISRIAQRVSPDTLHIVSGLGEVTPEHMMTLRKRVPGSVRLMRAVPVEDWSSVELALAFASVSDIVLLDTRLSGSPEIGATGLTHDWSISRCIVDQLDIPVILAGGLTPDNVVRAIQAVRPWGVDSMTGTDAVNSGASKDWGRVKRFVQAAKSVAVLREPPFQSGK